MLYRLLRPALFTLDPEAAHHLTIRALAALPAGTPPATGPLAITVAGVEFPNPVGLAAGYDKDATATDALFRLGFGSVEVGTIPPLPQPGNPRPRLFRLAEDRAVINRFGFNSGGSVDAAARLAARRHRPGVVGINIGANKDSVDKVADYAAMARLMAPLATYLTVNVSSPNTPGLRALQDPAALAGLLDAVIAARDESGVRPPVFLKVAPDLTPADIDAIARIALDRRLGALIIGNTTITRPGLRSAAAGETGGLSGAPLAPLAREGLRDFRKASGGALPLVAVGGIDSAAEAWARIRAGASLVQVYSAMVYEGPLLARRIARELPALMRRDGFTSLADAVGTEEGAPA